MNDLEGWTIYLSKKSKQAKEEEPRIARISGGDSGGGETADVEVKELRVIGQSQDWEMGFVNSLGRIFLPFMEHFPLLHAPSGPETVKGTNGSARLT